MDKEGIFEEKKKSLLDENEQTYGHEIREKFGNNSVNKSYQKFAHLTEEEYIKCQTLSEKLAEVLKDVAVSKDLKGDKAKLVFELHRDWLLYFWDSSMYSLEAHRGLGQMYLDDARFKEYYDKIVYNGAFYLKQIIDFFCS